MAEIDDVNAEEDMHAVMLPSGALFYVHARELGYMNERAKKYMSDNKFTNISDLQDVDRMVILEMLCWRWGLWVSRQRDYWNDAVDTDKLHKSINDASRELRQLKKSLGIDKETRDKKRGEDSVENYLSSLRERAMAFGYTREKQLDAALELFNDMKAVVELHYNCDAEERQELKVRETDVLKWLKDEVVPKFDEIDAHFRQKEQRYWIRKI